MLKPITNNYIDYSTPLSFCFGFRCDRCGNIWKSEIIQFSLQEFKEPIEDKLKSILWAKQYEQAYERANNEALFHFSHCPNCKRWVCNDCFVVSPKDYTDICIDCAKS